ncbi:conserved hypothetical protein [Streptomyces misionensis JCM 4497]
MGHPHHRRDRADPDDDQAGFLAAAPLRGAHRAEQPGLRRAARQAGPRRTTVLPRACRDPYGEVPHGHRDRHLRHREDRGGPAPDQRRRRRRLPRPHPLRTDRRQGAAGQPRLGARRRHPDRLPEDPRPAGRPHHHQRAADGRRDHRGERHQEHQGAARPDGHADRQHRGGAPARRAGAGRLHRADRARVQGRLPGADLRPGHRGRPAELRVHDPVVAVRGGRAGRLVVPAPAGDPGPGRSRGGAAAQGERTGRGLTLTRRRSANMPALPLSGADGAG